jgi:hypothetical protein
VIFYNEKTPKVSRRLFKEIELLAFTGRIRTLDGLGHWIGFFATVFIRLGWIKSTSRFHASSHKNRLYHQISV